MVGGEITQSLQSEAVEAIQQLSRREFWQLYAEIAKTEGEEAAKETLKMRCRNDVETFALVFFSRYCEYEFNIFHKDRFAAWARGEGPYRWADAAPRGSAKSTLSTLIKPVHDLCYGLESYICIISNTAPQSAQKLKDIRSELLENDLLISHYGPFFSGGKVAQTEYVASSGGHKCKFEAFGSATEIRGARFGESRPSKIILDDVEHSEEVENEALRTKFHDWFTQVVSKLGDKRTKIEVIGTVLHRDSLLKKLLRNPVYRGKIYKSVISFSTREDLWHDWTKIFTNLDNDNRANDALDYYLANKEEMLKGTKVLWPERASYLDLMIEMVEIGKKSFLKEMQNEPMSAGSALFDSFGFYEECDEGFRILETGVIVPRREIMETIGAMDPATGQRKVRAGRLGDFTCLLTGYTDTKGRLFIHDDITERLKPTEFIGRMFDWNDHYHYDEFGVETNLYRELLIPNLETERKAREAERRARGMQAWGIKMVIQEITQTVNKEKRIYTLEPKVKNRYILFNKRLSREYMSQMESFPDSSCHDDAPDCTQMLWSIVEKRYRPGLIGKKYTRG